MANLILRLSSSFACVQDKLDGKKENRTVFAHIVGQVHFEGARMGFLLKCKQKNEERRTRKDEERRRYLFVFLGSSFFVFCLYLNKKPILAPSKWTPPTMSAKTVSLFLPVTSLTTTQAKDEESRRKRFAITVN